MNVCVIPARGGSKRIPRKNIRNFCGKPMIAWSIEAAKDSQCFDHIVVSTDDEDIAKVSLDLGAKIPFMRPVNLSDDFTTTRSVVNHAICELSKLYGNIDMVCCLYPTAPFVSPLDLVLAQRMLEETDVTYVFSASTFAYPIQRAFRRTISGGLQRFQPQYRNTRSQDLETAFHDAGQFYWGVPLSFHESYEPVNENSRALILPRLRVHDIDTQEDWDHAELIFRSLFLQ